MEIGLLIKQYRHENNLTLREFATRCGTSHSYIAMLESGKNSKTGEPIVPSITMLKKIAQGMNLSINFLIDSCDDIPVTLNDAPTIETTPEEPKLSEGRQKLIDLAMSVPEEKVDKLLQLIMLFADDGQ